jgi:hypothetical protein
LPFEHADRVLEIGRDILFRFPGDPEAPARCLDEDGPINAEAAEELALVTAAKGYHAVMAMPETIAREKIDALRCTRRRPSRFCRALVQIERSTFHSYGLDAHSRVLLCAASTGGWRRAG